MSDRSPDCRHRSHRCMRTHITLFDARPALRRHSSRGGPARPRQPTRARRRSRHQTPEGARCRAAGQGVSTTPATSVPHGWSPTDSKLTVRTATDTRPYRATADVECVPALTCIASCKCQATAPSASPSKNQTNPTHPTPYHTPSRACISAAGGGARAKRARKHVGDISRRRKRRKRRNRQVRRNTAVGLSQLCPPWLPTCPPTSPPRS